MTEIFKEIIGIYKDKTKLPIVSTYIILLIVWNWDIISIYLFSSQNIETRICWISNMVSWYNHIFRILIPLTIAFFYPFISEFLMSLTDSKLQKIRSDRRKLKTDEQKENAQTKFSISELESGKRTTDELLEQIRQSNVQRDALSVRLKENELFYNNSIEDIKRENSSIIEEKNFIIKSLSERIQKKDDKDLQLQLILIYNEIKSLENGKNIIKDLIKKKNTFHMSKSFLTNSNLQFYEILYRHNLIDKVDSNNEDTLYNFTKKGREFIDLAIELRNAPDL